MCVGGLFANTKPKSVLTNVFFNPNLLSTLNHLIHFLYLDSLSYFNICVLMLLD